MEHCLKFFKLPLIKLREPIPAEHKVFSYPQLSIREQMAAYKEMIDGSSKEGFPSSP